MDQDNAPKKFSFPNSDQNIPGVSGQRTSMDGRPVTLTNGTEQQNDSGRPVVHILDALNQQPTNSDGEKTIRTYQADIADAIRNDNVSMIKVALAEKKRQEKRGSFDETVLGEKKSRLMYIVAGTVAVIVLVGLAGAFVFFGAQKAEEVFTQNTPPESIIFTESRIGINVDGRDGDDLSRLVKREKDEKLPLGEMKEIVLVTGTSSRPILTQEFFDITNSRVPDTLNRSLSDQFMLGIYSFSPYDTFAIFKVGFYDNAFAGMLEWEDSLQSDIGDFFIARKPAPVVTGSSTDAVSTPSEASTPPDSSIGIFNGDRFVDRVVQNHDARVLIDKYGNTLLLYTFLDKDTLVISSSDKALKEVMYRLTTGRIAR